MNGAEMFKGEKKTKNPANPIPLAFLYIQTHTYVLSSDLSDLSTSLCSGIKKSEDKYF